MTQSSPTTQSSDRSTDRGVAEILQFILLIGVFLAATFLALFLGVGQLSAIGDDSAEDTAINTLESVRTAHTDVATGTPHRSTDVRLDESQVTYRTDGSVSVSITAAGPGTGTIDESVAIQPLAIELDDGSVILENGAVINEQDSGNALITGPSYRISTSRSIITIYDTAQTAGPDALSSTEGTATLSTFRRSIDSSRIQPSDGGTAANATVDFTVSSPRADSWESYFNDLDNIQSVSRSGDSVTVTFETEDLLVRIVELDQRLVNE